MDSLRAHILVAAPELRDPNFACSVVLLVEHNADGALGLVLNRRTNVPVKKAWEQVKDTPCLTTESLYVGGPCQGPLMVVHQLESFADKEVLPGVYFSVEPDHVEELVAQDSQTLRFFAGFAGWGAGQLEAELREGSWLTLPGSTEQIFHADENLWQKVRRKIAGETLTSALHIKHVPPDPSMN